MLANFFDGLRLVTSRVSVDAAVGVTRTADLLKTIRIEKMVLCHITYDSDDDNELGTV